MNKKTIRKVNGGIAIHYGLSIALMAIVSLIGIGIWLFRVINDQVEFSWGTLSVLTMLTAVLGVFGYVILRVGYGEIEK